MRDWLVIRKFEQVCMSGLGRTWVSVRNLLYSRGLILKFAKARQEISLAAKRTVSIVDSAGPIK